MSTVASEKLILCAGPYQYDGFKTLDANPDYRPDYCEVLPPLPRELRRGQWDEIYLIHGIEHFHIWEAEELIPQIYEALALGGFVVFEQPNVEVAARVMLGLIPSMTPNKPEASGINAIYGDRAHQNPLMAHKWGYSPDSMRELVIKSGFSPDKVKVGRALSRPFAEGRDFRLEATK